MIIKKFWNASIENLKYVGTEWIQCILLLDGFKDSVSFRNMAQSAEFPRIVLDKIDAF